MGNVHKGNIHLTLQAFEFQLHFLAQLQVQSAKRFVQQQNTGLVDQAAGNGHALLLAARQLVDAAALKAAQAHGFQHFQHFGADGFLRQLFQPQAKGHILVHVQVREQCVFLEHGIHLPLIRRYRGDILAIEKDIARFWGNKPGDHTQGGCFAAAGRAKERNKLLIVDVKGKFVQDSFPVKIDDNVFQ